MMKAVVSLVLFSFPLFSAEEEVAFLEPNLQVPVVEDVEFSATDFIPRSKSPAFAVTLAAFCPGLGHAYLGDYTTAGTLFGSSSLLYTLSSTDFSEEAPSQPSFATLQNTWFYNIYAAYRDARNFNGQEKYFHKMPTESFVDLAWAPFQWSVLKKPEVWGGFVGVFALFTGLAHLFPPSKASTDFRGENEPLNPFLAFPVGIGEESFFRGYLQSALAETLTPWSAIALTSLAFGAVHIPNGIAMAPEKRKQFYTVGIPVITAFGAYFGWLTHKSGSLKQSVALHSWYDFVVFLASYSAAHSATIGKPSFAIAFPF